jgi:hypothetical protein
MRSKGRDLKPFDQPQREARKSSLNLGPALKMKIIICFRHLKCIGRKWCRGMDYSWHVQHLLREFGRGQFAR